MSKLEQANWRVWGRDVLAFVIFMLGGVGIWHSNELKIDALSIKQGALVADILDYKQHVKEIVIQTHEVAMKEINRVNTQGCGPSVEARRDIAVIKADIASVKKGQDQMMVQMNRIEDRLSGG